MSLCLNNITLSCIGIMKVLKSFQYTRIYARGLLGKYPPVGC
jgi:hypothetical protein